MHKFKAGDIVRNSEGLIDIVELVPGDIIYDKRHYLDSELGFLLRKHSWELQYDWKLVTNNKKGTKSMARRTFKQLKDTPDVRKGALWQEACDDGDQEYILITPEFQKGNHTEPNYPNRENVEDEPQWFVEVFKVTPEYMTKEELEKFEAFKKTQSKRLVGRPKKVTK